MAMLGEKSAAVADPDDHLSSSAVAAESSASGSGDWGVKIECARSEDHVTVCSMTTTFSEFALVHTPLPLGMDADSQASPVPGGTSEVKEATTEANEAESQLSASVGKAAGASSAVAEMAPPAVEESSNQGDLPEQRAARPAPGSAAKAPPPEPPNEFWRRYIPVENPWPASETMIPPQNCKAPPHIPPVGAIEGSLRRSTGS